MDIDEIADEAVRLAAQRAVGSTFTWKELFGPERWNAFPKRTKIGENLKKRVLAGELDGIEHAGRHTSQNWQLFRRV